VAKVVLKRSSQRRDLSPQAAALRLIPEAVAWQYTVLPLCVEGNTLRVAMANPADLFVQEALAAQCQMRIEPEARDEVQIRAAIARHYRNYADPDKQTPDTPLSDADGGKESQNAAVIGASVAKALNMIIDEAVKTGVSDIHLQPQENKLLVRYRIDGTLRETLTLPLETNTPLVSRIKVLAGMNIADHHRPQDGRFTIEGGGHLIDIRVGTVPTVFGEMAVLRLLDKSRAMMSLADLGFLPESLSAYERMINKPYGMLLVSGPTGAGKTTTLYASLNSLNQTENNIITIEDPVEYQFKNINQIQVNPRAGVTFASGLRSILRLDPDVILVGEIRDAETAAIAVQSALTGHLVLSSIHANDSISVIYRLIDLGVEPFLLSSAIIGVVSQRMVRQICPDCGRPVKAGAVEEAAYKKEVGQVSKKFHYGAGCSNCGNTGYSGRCPIFEILEVSDEMRRMLLAGSTIEEMRHQAAREGMKTLAHDGMLKVKAGVTTPAEVLRQAYTGD